MSLYDRQQGVMDGSAATARSYGAAINQWEAHAAQLQSRLQAATNQAEEMAKQRLFALATVEGQAALIRALKYELGRTAVNSSLLQDETVRKKISGQAMADYLQKHGYHYDQKTERVKKIAP